MKAEAKIVAGFFSRGVYQVICACMDKEGGQGVWTPLKDHKDIGFHGNSGSDSLEILTATKPAFNVGPLSDGQ